MKKIINKFLILALAFSSVISCKDPDNAIYDVFDGLEHGAILRTLEVTSANYNISDLNSKFEVIIEEQDEKSGALLSSVNVYINYTDNYDDGVNNSKAEALIKSISASEFTTSANKLPTKTVTVTLGEVFSTFNLVEGAYNAGDLVSIRLEVVLTDGRIFSADDASGGLQGSYFLSPYKYTAAILCKPYPGDYRVVMHDSYGDGWQTNTGSGGYGIQITVDGALMQVGLCTPYGGGSWLDVGGCTPNDGYEGEATITIPVGTEEVSWYFPGDAYGEISFEIYGPTGTLLWAVGVGEGGPGSLPVVLCAP
ncbi:MAG: hypothetical protein HQ490_04840 [Lutibacter sp.]|nr:hypothetical protein [Lutibacter sp.]